MLVYMVRIITCLLALLINLSLSYGGEHITKVAIVDTGLDIKDTRFSSLVCGHKDFTGEGILDKVGHGTHVAGLIKQYAKKSKFCLIILKFYSEKASGDENVQRLNLALEEAVKQKAEIVNFSGGGDTFSETEYRVIKTHPRVKFIVAAGNDKKNIDEKDNEYFPASYNLPNILVVGALDKQGKRYHLSNYGSNVKVWEIGEDVLSTLPYPKTAGFLSGTSMSTAIYTGKYLYEKTH